eukprot:4630446-Ditylum_brightwellii.AAC.1
MDIINQQVSCKEMGALERLEILEYHDAKIKIIKGAHGIVKRGGNNGQRGKLWPQGMTKEANTYRADTIETKVMIMQGKEEKLTTKEAISMIQEETSTT